ncbi:MAG: hypothetical protein Q9226_000766 [Calogaya cf. arnoldii]
MHLETLLYMLLQSDETRPPPGPVPNFEALGQEAKKAAVGNEWIKIPATTIFVGMDDLKNDNGSARYLGWDNEKPMRKQNVPAFEAQARPLTNEDFARYMHATNQDSLPASWTQRTSSGGGDAKAEKESCGSPNAYYLNGHSEPLGQAYLDGKFVRTVYGPVPLRHALAWPVFASHDELAGCANWMNGRIPTAEEVLSIYHHVDVAKKKEAEKVQARLAGVNGHLSNDGVEESPPSGPANGFSSVRPCLIRDVLFLNLEKANVGFRYCHPTPVTQLGNKLCGRGELGGVWEWTSSRLEKHDGFEPMAEYPGYTADFFDGKHNM